MTQLSFFLAPNRFYCPEAEVNFVDMGVFDELEPDLLWCVYSIAVILCCGCDTHGGIKLFATAS